MAFTDRILDQTKLGNPFDLVVKQTTTYYGLGSQTNILYTLRHTYFYDTHNFFKYFPDTNVYHVQSLADTNILTLLSTDHLVHVNFLLDDKSEFFYRNYTTFLDVLASISGLLKFLKLITSIPINPLTKQNLRLKLIN